MLFADERQKVDVVILMATVGQDAHVTCAHSTCIAVIGLSLVDVLDAALTDATLNGRLLQTKEEDFFSRKILFVFCLHVGRSR